MHKPLGRLRQDHAQTEALCPARLLLHPYLCQPTGLVGAHGGRRAGALAVLQLHPHPPGFQERAPARGGAAGWRRCGHGAPLGPLPALPSPARAPRARHTAGVLSRIAPSARSCTETASSSARAPSYPSSSLLLQLTRQQTVPGGQQEITQGFLPLPQCLSCTHEHVSRGGSRPSRDGVQRGHRDS